MPKSNYNHARRQKELARKLRQQEKQQRRSARPDPGSTAPADKPAPMPESGK